MKTEERVKTSQLGPVIKRFIDNHNREYPQVSTGGSKAKAKTHINVLVGRDYICERTGFNNKKIWEIVEQAKETVSFETADILLCAIDRPDAWHTEVDVIVMEIGKRAYK